MLQRQLSKSSSSSSSTAASTSGIGSARSGSSSSSGFGRVLGRSNQDRLGQAPASAAPSQQASAPASGRTVVPTIYQGKPKRGPEGPESAAAPTPAPAPASDGVLRPAKFKTNQEGALIGKGGSVALASTQTGTDAAYSVADGTPATITQVKGERIKVRVRQGKASVEGWVDASLFSDQPGLARDEENAKLPEDHVYSRIDGDHSPKSPTGKDTAQGGLGDCFFIASMAAVANAAPGIITDMVKYDPQKKTYTVRFYEEQGRGQSKPVYIEVDAFLPTSAGSRNDPSYAGDPGGKMWPAIIEKAYAKWKGGYHVIGEGGLGEQAMAEITGGRSTFRNPASMKESEVVPYFKQAQKEGKAIYAGVVSSVKSTQQQVLSGSGDGPFRGNVKQTHRWNEIVPGSVTVTDTKGKAPSARDLGKEGDESGKLSGRGVKAGTVGYKSSSLELSYETGKAPADARDLVVAFDYEGVVDTEGFIIGNHGYAFEGVVQGDKLQFYNPWGSYQPKPISAATFIKYFDSIALNAPPAQKTRS
jgi:hypothetical protein